MAGAKLLQPSFTGGELSPSLYARVDIARYGTSLRTCRNYIVRPYGGVSNRSGTRYICTNKDSTKRTRVIPFQFNTDQTYVLIITNQTIRFITNGAQLVDGGGNPYELGAPWVDDDIFDLNYTQSNDVMTLVHPDYPPQNLSRLTPSTFSLTPESTANGPFADINANEAWLMAASAAAGVITVTTNIDTFTADMVGQLIYIENKNKGLVKPWTQNERFSTGSIGTLRYSDNKTYRLSALSGTTGYYVSGNMKPTHDYGKAWDGGGYHVDDGGTTGGYNVGVEWEYVDSGFGIVKITAFTNARTVQAVVQVQLPAGVVGGIGAPAGTWSAVGDGVTKTFPLAGNVSASNSNYLVTIAGVPVQSNPAYQPPTSSGGGLCVDCGSFLPDGRLAGDIEVGDKMMLVDPVTLGPGIGIVTYSKRRSAPCVRIITRRAILVCSTTAPIPVKGEGYIDAGPDLVGKLIPVMTLVDGHAGQTVGWDEVIGVEDAGQIDVQHITVGDKCFWAGAQNNAFIAHHNMKPAQE